ncbi:protein of unknown function [Rhodovastum atsumiense]|nr:protein of unknown function [Rhodovastum atsumiense]
MHNDTDNLAFLFTKDCSVISCGICTSDVEMNDGRLFPGVDKGGHDISLDLICKDEITMHWQ